MDITIQVTGFEELARKVNDPALIAEPTREFLTQTTLDIQRSVQGYTPVDMGELYASINQMVDPSPLPLYGLVSTRLQPHYAQDMEYGTAPHWAPIAALKGWAHRHNMNPYAIQRKIAKYGTKPHHMFFNAALNAWDKININLAKMAEAIEVRWGSK
jgi:hypothetical protein